MSSTGKGKPTFRVSLYCAVCGKPYVEGEEIMAYLTSPTTVSCAHENCFNQHPELAEAAKRITT